MNKIILIGRSVKQAEIRATATGKQVASFTLAVDRDFKNAQGERSRFPSLRRMGQAGRRMRKVCDKGQADSGSRQNPNTKL